MKKLLIIASALAITAACTKTYDIEPVAQPEIAFGTWNDVMTKAVKSEFANGDIFNVFGYKWNNGETPGATTVFAGDEVTYNSSNQKWAYSPTRYWDNNYDNYTFYAAYPSNQLSGTLADYAQNGLFVTNNLSFNGTDENLLIAQKKTVAKASYNNAVALVFKHTGALVDIKFKKHSDIADAEVAITSLTLSDIQTSGSFTVASYDGTSGDPVGATVPASNGIAGLGWTPNSTPATNPTTGEGSAPYLASNKTIAAATGAGVANAGDIINNLVVMPQALGTAAGPKLTLTYTITTGVSPNTQTVTFSDKSVYFGQFDETDPNDGENPENDNTTPFISAWMPGVHYTYFITINANSIEFTASVASWTDATLVNGHHYLVN